jgi:ribonuclease P protein component
LDNGVKVVDRVLVVVALKGEDNRGCYSRLGLVVSKKVGNAITRNRIKRVIRESFRMSEQKSLCNFDVVVIARAAARNSSNATIKTSFEKHLKNVTISK